MMAARIGGLADGGEILVSSLVTGRSPPTRGDLKFGEGRAVALKGIEGPYAVFTLDWA